jgi:hypothetical protein
VRKAFRPFAFFPVAALAGSSLLVWDGALPAPVCAAQSNHAGMVIRFSAEPESQRSWCLQFASESLSGIDALRLTGLPVVTKPFGPDGEYVCKIGAVGTEAADCPAKDGSYWGYWRMTSEGWRHSGIGASAARVRCGSLEGWAWLQGGTGPAPSVAESRSICPSTGCGAAPSTVLAPPARREGQGPGGDEKAQPDESSRPAETPRTPRQPAVNEREGLTSSAEREGDTRASTPVARRKTRWTLYGGLAGVIASLAAARAYLFFRHRSSGKSEP